MGFVDVGCSVVPNVVGTSVGPVGFDVGPIQSPNRVLAFHFINACLTWSSSS